MTRGRRGPRPCQNQCIQEEGHDGAHACAYHVPRRDDDDEDDDGDEDDNDHDDDDDDDDHNGDDDDDDASVMERFEAARGAAEESSV